MNQIYERRSLLIALSGVVLGATALFSGAASAQNTLERIKKEGVVRLGFANEAPYGYATPDGKLTGEAPEIAKVILKRMGVSEIEGVLTPFRSLIPGLQAGRFDIVAAGMYVTPKRCEQVIFSEPTYSMGQAMLVPPGNPKDIHSFQAFVKNPNLRLGLLGGGQAHKTAQALGIKNSQISLYQDGLSGIAALEAGRIDAWTQTGLAVQRLLDSSAGAPVERAAPFEQPVIDGKETRGHGAFAFRKEDVALRDAFNDELKKFLGTPEHRKLVRQFGFTEEERPTKTTAELCKGQ